MGFSNPKHSHLVLTLFHLAKTIPSAPTCFSQANKDARWREAMSAEISALLQAQTWSLVKQPAHQNIVICKWVYRIKQKPEGSIDRFKAR